MKSGATYVYCVIDRGSTKKLAAPPAGMPDAEKPRIVPLEDWASIVVADVPLPEYSGESIEKKLQDLDWVSRCAVAHEAVVEHYAKLVAVVPMKMFTLFTSEKKATADLSAKKKAITKVLDRVRGREEWGVRLAFDEVRAKKSASGAAEKPSSSAASGARSGKEFLQRKKGERDVRERFRANAANDATALFDELAVACADARRRPMPAVSGGGPRVVLDAAFLVPRDEADRFFAKVDEERKRLFDAGYDVVLTGPWPPYNFVEESSK